jgi:type IV secretory pathway VirB4 component
VKTASQEMASQFSMSPVLESLLLQSKVSTMQHIPLQWNEHEDQATAWLHAATTATNATNNARVPEASISCF